MKEELQNLTDEQMKMVSGAGPYEDYWNQFRQKDGTYKYNCPVCGKLMCGKSIDEITDNYSVHLEEHSDNILPKESILNWDIPNPYKGQGL